MDRTEFFRRPADRFSKLAKERADKAISAKLNGIAAEYRDMLNGKASDAGSMLAEAVKQAERTRRECEKTQQYVLKCREAVERSRVLIERLDAHVAKLDPGAGLGSRRL